MVYIFLADGFEIIEALAPVDMLTRAGVKCKLVGVTGDYVTSSNSTVVKSDVSISEVSFSNDVEMVILPGGMPGTLNLEKNSAVIDIVKKAYSDGKFVCAICAAPSILAHLGVLNGVKATCFPTFKGELSEAVYTGGKVERSGNIITARGAGVAVDFGIECVKALKGEQTAKDISAQIQM